MNLDDKKLVYILVGLPVAIAAFFIGVYVGGDGSRDIADSSLTATQLVEVDQFEPFWRAWQILDEKYVASASTTAEARVWGAIQGLASSFDDPYTVFFPPEESKMFNEDISGNFEGVGMEIGVRNEQLTVVAPIRGSPADLSGVRSGDAILQIDSKPASEMPVDQAVKLIRGPRGTQVVIVFLPQGSTKPVERTITRQIINIPTLETSTKPGNIFVIRLFSFTAQSPTLFRNALREFIASGSTKLILDLRGNPGGYLDAAWDIASWFLPTGKVVVNEDFGFDKGSKAYRSKGYNIFDSRLQMIVLVDGGSASASEILAGALQEHGVAKLVGTKTFGKGSIQELVPLTPETSLKITIARWLTPLGHDLSEGGLEPDYKIKLPEAGSTTTALADKDLAMEKAIELLTSNQ